MAADPKPARKDSREEPVTLKVLQSTLKSSLQTFEQSMLEKFKGSIDLALQPLVQQMSQFAVSLEQTKGTAESAFTLGSELQTENLTLKQDNALLKERLLIVETDTRNNHLKLRGFAENPDKEADLLKDIPYWLASVLQWEDSTRVPIVKMYRLGSPNKPNRRFARDILIQFLDTRDKLAIQKIAREHGFLLYNDKKINVFPDLPPDALKIRQQLKETTSRLRDLKISYRWMNSGQIKVSYQGKFFFAKDAATGKQLLNDLNIDVPMEEQKQASKRRLEFALSPLKATKIPVLSSSKD